MVATIAVGSPFAACTDRWSPGSAVVTAGCALRLSAAVLPVSLYGAPAAAAAPGGELRHQAGFWVYGRRLRRRRVWTRERQSVSQSVRQPVRRIAHMGCLLSLPTVANAEADLPGSVSCIRWRTSVRQTDIVSWSYAVRVVSGTVPPRVGGASCHASWHASWSPPWRARWHGGWGEALISVHRI